MNAQNDWLDRYVDAVKRQLPHKQANDLAAEIRSSLQDEIEAREEALGRRLQEEELLDLLRRRGAPLLVAAGYHERRSLVDESLFPFYKRALSWLLLGLLVLHLAGTTSDALSARGFGLWHALIGFWWDYAHAALLAFASLTLGFHLLQEPLRKWSGLRDWQPRSLPAVRSQGQTIGRGSSAFEFIFELLLLRLINLDLVAPHQFERVGIAGWSEAARPWVHALSGLLIACLALTVVNLFQPWWTRLKRGISATLGLAMACVLLQLYLFEPLFELTGAQSMAPLFMQRALAWVAVFAAATAAWDAWQAWRRT